MRTLMKRLGACPGSALISSVVVLGAGASGIFGCALIVGLDQGYQLVEGSGGSGGVPGTSTTSSGGGAPSTTTSSSSSSASTSSISSPGTGGSGGATNSRSSTGAGGATSSSASTGGGGTGGMVACVPQSSIPCYTGAPATQGIGVCKGGTKTCNAQGDGYGPCVGEITPLPESCGTPVDDDCDGTALDPDVGCLCFPGTTTSCYSGPGATDGIGICKAGLATCKPDGKSYDTCMGEVLPMLEDCMTPQDEDCDGSVPPCLGGQVWAKRFGDGMSQIAKGVAVQLDGTSLWTGYMNGSVNFGTGVLASPGGTDVFLAKLDLAGTTVWAKRFGDGSSQEGRAVAVDASGNAAITGAFGGTINFGGAVLTTAGSNDIFLAKLDAAGNHIFSKNFGNNSNQYGNSVAFTPAGEIVITGYLGGAVDFGGGLLTSAGSTDMFVAKFAADGTHQWSKIAGNSLAQIATSVAVQPAGDIIVTGNFAGQIDFGATSTLTTAGLNDIFLVSYDTAGNDTWVKKFGDSSDQLANAAATDGSGNIALVGSFAGVLDFGCGALTSAGGNDAFLAVLGPTGACSWSKRFGDGAEQMGYGVTFDVDGNVIVTGSFAGSINLTGQVLTSAGGLDVFVAKFDPGGAAFWSKKVGDATDQNGFCAGADGSKDVLVGGGFTGTVNFGGGVLTSAGTEDIFFAKLSP